MLEKFILGLFIMISSMLMRVGGKECVQGCVGRLWAGIGDVAGKNGKDLNQSCSRHPELV